MGLSLNPKPMVCGRVRMVTAKGTISKNEAMDSEDDDQS